MSLIIAALLFSLAYAPSLFWLRKLLGGCRPAAVFPLASALVLNLPVFLIGILAIGRTLAPSEAFAFIAHCTHGYCLRTGFRLELSGQNDITYGHGNSHKASRTKKPSGPFEFRSRN